MFILGTVLSNKKLWSNEKLVSAISIINNSAGEVEAEVGAEPRLTKKHPIEHTI